MSNVKNIEVRTKLRHTGLSKVANLEQNHNKLCHKINGIDTHYQNQCVAHKN